MNKSQYCEDARRSPSPEKPEGTFSADGVSSPRNAIANIPVKVNEPDDSAPLQLAKREAPDDRQDTQELGPEAEEEKIKRKSQQGF